MAYPWRAIMNIRFQASVDEINEVLLGKQTRNVVLDIFMPAKVQIEPCRIAS